MQKLEIVWLFFQNQILALRWLNDLIASALSADNAYGVAKKRSR